MKKEEIIKNIKVILKQNGCFSIGELDYFDASPCIGGIGTILGLVEYFTEDYAEINVYQSSNSDAIESYQEKYENLSEEVLDEILCLCQSYQEQCINNQLN